MSSPTPRPVRGDDEQTHLAYELFVMNATYVSMTVDQVEVLGPDGEVIGELPGEELQSTSSASRQPGIGGTGARRLHSSWTNIRCW